MKGIDIPISLSYHAAGVRLDDIASNVGIGWSLNYGDFMTSATYGLDDVNDTNGWTNTGSTFPQTGYLQTDDWPVVNGWQTNPAYNYIKSMAEGELFETQPDLYYLDINGRSLEFFYN